MEDEGLELCYHAGEIKPMNELIVPMLAVFMAFFVQSNTGFGAGLLSIPLLLGSMGFVEASGVMAPLFALFSVIMIWRTWKDADKKMSLELAVSGTLGLALGTFFLVQFGAAEWMKPVIGAFILVYVGMSLFAKNRLSVFNRLGSVFGLAGGFSSGFFSSGGQFFVMYANSKINKMDVLRATTIASLGVTNLFRIPFHVYGGVMTLETLKYSALLLPAFGLGIFAGEKLYARVNKRIVKEVVIGLLLVIGIKLLVS